MPGILLGMANKSNVLAALSVELLSTGVPDAFRIFPYGRFRSSDGSGRPETPPEGWLLTPERAAELVAAAAQRRNKIVIDYEHQTLYASQNGQPAPAAGWIGRLEARDDGLYAVEVTWTTAAAGLIAEKAYRYISPSFWHSTESGEIVRLVNVALVNQPGLDGLTDLAALAAHFLYSTKETQPMKKLLAALGLPETANEDEALTALTAQRNSHESAVASLSAKIDAPDPSKFVTVATFTALQTEHKQTADALAALQARVDAEKIDALIETAKASGRLTPASEAYARELAKKDFTALLGFISAQPVIVKPGETQTGGSGPKGGAGGQDSKAIAAAALAYQVEQSKCGLLVSTSQAVTHVTQKGDQ